MLRETFQMLREQFPDYNYEESSLTIWDERPERTEQTAALGSIRRASLNSKMTWSANEMQSNDV